MRTSIVWKMHWDMLTREISVGKSWEGISYFVGGGVVQ